MKAILDHIGVAVTDLSAALAFYRDALGLDVEPPEEVPSQRVRAQFVPVGEPKLELLEATDPESPIAKYIDKRGPGLHHITLRVDDIRGALAQLKARGARLVDDEPRAGAEGALVAFVHPSAAAGVLVELKQSAARSGVRPPRSAVSRHTLGELELISVSDGFVRFDGGAMFGAVPKTLWEPHAPADTRNRITLAMRPLIVRGARTMLIDAGLGAKDDARFHDRYGVDRSRSLDDTLADAGVAREDIDIVVATHLHFDHAGGFTLRDASGRIRPAFPRARYVVRRGEWDDAIHPHARNRASYRADDFVPLADAGVLLFVDEDQTIMPGVRVQRTGGHTMHHQMILIESNGRAAAFVGDLIPTTAHLADAWIMGYDLYPVDTLSAKQRFARMAVEREMLVFFEHDPNIAAGYIRETNGTRTVQQVS
jgi:methylmalonyl-CoA epimerase